MKKKVSLKDIAQKVGVSIALVSYVLNNKKEGRISKEIAEKIKATAKKLNYRPNQIARSLKTKKTFTIGLIVADISNPFFSTLARIVEYEAEKSNYTVIFGSSDEKPESSQKLIDILLDRQVDGIIIAPTENTEDQIQQLKKNGTPFVLVDRYFPTLNVNYVGINNYEAALKATRHLIEAGCRRIGMISFKTSLWHLQERKRGFATALKKAGLACEKKLMQEVSLSATREEVIAAVQQLLSLSEPVDALFFSSNKLSTYGLQYINTLSLTVPDDVAILSFDESEATELFYASLTHIRQRIQEIGEQAVKILLENINGNKKVTQLYLDADLVIGQSSALLKPVKKGNFL